MIATFDMVPNYFDGFTFRWTVDPAFHAPHPWQFVVQETKDDATWEDISSVIGDAYVYQEHRRRIYPRTNTVKFRIRSIADGTEYVSFPRSPYAVLDRREFLLAREIMRKELLLLKRMSGVPIVLYKVSLFSEFPAEGKDPISGAITDPDYEIPGGYYGPYDLYGKFEPQERSIKQDETGKGFEEQHMFSVRTIGFPYISAHDIVFDDVEDRAFHVEEAKDVAEIRRLPIVQQLTVKEMVKSDPAYRLRVCA